MQISLWRSKLAALKFEPATIRSLVKWPSDLRNEAINLICYYSVWNHVKVRIICVLFFLMMFSTIKLSCWQLLEVFTFCSVIMFICTCSLQLTWVETIHIKIKLDHCILRCINLQIKICISISDINNEVQGWRVKNNTKCVLIFNQSLSFMDNLSALRDRSLLTSTKKAGGGLQKLTSS